MLFALLTALALASPSLAQENPFSLTEPLPLRWEYETDRTINLTPAATEEIVYLPLEAGTLLSLYVADGQLQWKEETGGEISAAPVADVRGVYVATETGSPTSGGGHFARATGALRALGGKSGVTLWMRTLQSPIRGSLASSGTHIFGGSNDGRVYALRKETGEVSWMMQLNASFASQPVLRDGLLYIGSEEGTLWALDEKSGETRWRYRTQGALRGPVAVADGMLFFGSADNYIYALRVADGRLLWRTRTGAEVQAVVHTPRGLLVASLDNFVYLLSTRRGERVWKRQLAGRIAAQPLTASDSVLLTPLSGDACVVLDLKDGKMLNNLPVGEGNNMAASPLLRSNILLVTTRRGLLAFSTQPGPNARPIVSRREP